MKVGGHLHSQVSFLPGERYPVIAVLRILASQSAARRCPDWVVAVLIEGVHLCPNLMQGVGNSGLWSYCWVGLALIYGLLWRKHVARCWHVVHSLRRKGAWIKSVCFVSFCSAMGKTGVCIDFLGMEYVSFFWNSYMNTFHSSKDLAS